MFEWFGLVSFCSHTKVADFTRHLKDGNLMGSRCTACGEITFPPRADCPACLGGEFAYHPFSGKGTVATFCTIEAAPAGFEAHVPYTVGVVDLEEGGRLLAWFGASIETAGITIGMPVQVVPGILEESEQIKVLYTLETPGTAWVRSGSQGESK